MKQISVVIPVYNVENFVEECIESVLQQTYRNIEIILVDDGSTDSSGEICDKWANKDERIIVYHKANGGLSDARNYGIQRAHGFYIYLLDSDDFLLKSDSLELMVRESETLKADIVIAAYAELQNDKKDHFIQQEKKGYLLEKASALAYQCDYATYRSIFVVAHNKLYKKALFEQISYPEGKLHEDEFTTYKLYLKADKIVYLPYVTYAYRIRENSIMTSRYHLAKLDAIEAFEEKVSVLEKEGFVAKDTKYLLLIHLSIHLYRMKKYGYMVERQELKKKFLTYYSLYKKEFSWKRQIHLFIYRYFGDFWWYLKKMN